MTAGLLAGAVIGDFVKGAIPADWPKPLKLGVRLHRKVDAISNRNQHLRAMSQHFPQELRRYAPIFVDLLSDGLLIESWQRFYTVELKAFAQLCYRSLNAAAVPVPGRGPRFIAYLESEDLLTRYDQPEVLTNAVSAIMRRLGKRAPAMNVEYIVEAIADRGAVATHDFDVCYEELRRATVAYAHELTTNAAPRSS